MDLKLKDKVAIVLAASKGIGKAVALALSAEGAKVIITSRNADELNKTAAEIQQQTGNQVMAIPADVSDGKQMTDLIKKVADTFAKLESGLQSVEFVSLKSHDTENRVKEIAKDIVFLPIGGGY